MIEILPDRIVPDLSNAQVQLECGKHHTKLEGED